ncbi:hypothetical protein AYI69_g9097 [Smittium culicis]|uniref:CCHC-type domain-containing protein n=2 Tax=Smittium culicis TaxID=133412 RepID=A0A1R1XF22_9FUNG|nr:hypothetical protein AYI69_g9097 [Smittium culicis]
MNEFRPVKRRRARQNEYANSTTNFRPIKKVNGDAVGRSGDTRSLKKTYDNPSGAAKTTKSTKPTTKKINYKQKPKNKSFMPAKQAENSQYGEVSLKHLVNGGLYSNLKKFCVGVSDRKIGCSWQQFEGDHEGAFNFIMRSLIGDFYCVQEDLRAQTTYYIFDEDASAKKLLSLALVHNGKRIEFYQTVKFEEDVTIISIPNHRDMGILTMIKLIKEQLLPLGTIDDVSAWAQKGTNAFIPFGMKVLFRKSTPETEIPSFLVHPEGRIGLFYKGCVEACSFCKKVGHWKSACPDIELKEIEKINRKNIANQKKAEQKLKKSAENRLRPHAFEFKNAKTNGITHDTLIDRRTTVGGADAFKMGALAARNLSQNVDQSVTNSGKSAKIDPTKPSVLETLFENLTKFQEKAIESITTNQPTEISSSGSSPVAKPAEIVDLFGPNGVVDTEFDDEFKSMSKNYQQKQKIRTIKPTPTDSPAPSSSSEYSEADYFDDKGAEMLKIKQESDYNRGHKHDTSNDGDIDMDSAPGDANHTADAPKAF